MAHLSLWTYCCDLTPGFRIGLSSDMSDETEVVGVVPPPKGRIAMLPAGAVVAGRYEIRYVSGTGGFSVVYAAADRETGADVALKMLRRDRATPDTLARFEREVTIARDIVSPHLVRIYDLGEFDGSLYLTMELMSGGSLDERLEAGALPIEQAVEISTYILEGLAALHDVGIIHRDVKPGNILISGDGTMKLGDFGLARHWNDEDTITRRRTAGLVGTYAYISPEQALGQEFDARSDLYSFGIVLFEMLTGRVPWPARSSIAAIVAHLHSDVPDVRDFEPATPAWLAALVARLLQKDRRLRPDSAAAILANVRRKC